MKEISYDEMMEEYITDPNTQKAVASLATKHVSDIALVIFQNRMMDSGAYGHTSVVLVGPSRTYKTIRECEGKYIHDLPSQREYAVAYVRLNTSYVGRGNEK